MNMALPNIRNKTAGVLQPIAITTQATHRELGTTVRYTASITATTIARQAVTVSQWAQATTSLLTSTGSLRAQVEPKTTTMEQHIARVLDMTYIWNAARCPRMAVPSCWLYPPGMVKVAAKVTVAMRVATRV